MLPQHRQKLQCIVTPWITEVPGCPLSRHHRRQGFSVLSQFPLEKVTAPRCSVPMRMKLDAYIPTIELCHLFRGHEMKKPLRENFVIVDRQVGDEFMCNVIFFPCRTSTLGCRRENFALYHRALLGVIFRYENAFSVTHQVAQVESSPTPLPKEVGNDRIEYRTLKKQ